jgi:hypothetical protein
MFNKIKLVFVILSIAIISGCASIKKAPIAMDTEAKQFKTNAAVAQVYVYRNESLGAALSMPVAVDGKLAGNTGANSFFKFDLSPGVHKISSQGDESEITINTEAGKLYFIWQEVKMGMFSGGSKLQIVDEKEGMKGVSECTLIESKL